MIGDRVVLTSKGMFVNESQREIVPVYKLRLDDNKNPIVANDGTLLVECVGGVNGGEKGSIKGDPVRVSRTQLRGYKHETPGLGLKDDVLLFPIMLEHYQQVAWVFSDHVKPIQGGKV